MSWRWCCCRRGCSDAVDCYPDGMTGLEVVIPGGAFAQDFCTGCGDLSGSYALTLQPSGYYEYRAATYCACLGCGYWGLWIYATIVCNEQAPPNCTIAANIRIDRPDGFGGWDYQRWVYDGPQFYATPPSSWSVDFLTSENIGNPCASGWPPVFKWPYNIDIYPATLSISAIVP